jgi:hypothetical protein
MRDLTYKIARFLQFAGLIILPFAISGNVAEKLDLRQSLILSAVGVGIFFVGWLLQQTSKPE